ncbi:MAG TPA: type II toxin-antitoxin system HicA family toxin [Pyrinomonadaceae bacterium]|jgi:predicted RNA binding protein YcfA (HicA-like mRNA interferase family)|nr:type II toxin-antitoxin system HicA family toxin [Pyrinomonadaceae bacterium]
MPPKIRELIAELERNGFTNRGGKGSNRNYEHILGIRLTVSGKLGDDARKYQEKLVKDAIKKVKTK